MATDVLAIERAVASAAMALTNPAWNIGHIRLSLSTVNPTYEISGITHVTPCRMYGNIPLGPVLGDRESVPTASSSPVSPFLLFVVTEPSRIKSVRMEGCHVGLFREFVGTACCTYGQSNMTILVWAPEGLTPEELTFCLMVATPEEVKHKVTQAHNGSEFL